MTSSYEASGLSKPSLKIKQFRYRQARQDVIRDFTAR